MAVYVILLAVTLLMLGWVVAWASSAQLRQWMEAPKYRIPRWEKRFPRADRVSRPAGRRRLQPAARLAAG
jgi:hypothetical protein